MAGELKITGYSAYLHPLDEGRLLGVGREATEDGRVTGAKVTLFDVSDPADPPAVDTWELADGLHGCGVRPPGLPLLGPRAGRGAAHAGLVEQLRGRHRPQDRRRGARGGPHRARARRDPGRLRLPPGRVRQGRRDGRPGLRIRRPGRLRRQLLLRGVPRRPGPRHAGRLRPGRGRDRRRRAPRDLLAQLLRAGADHPVAGDRGQLCGRCRGSACRPMPSTGSRSLGRCAWGERCFRLSRRPRAGRGGVRAERASSQVPWARRHGCAWPLPWPFWRTGGGGEAAPGESGACCVSGGRACCR